MPTWWGLGKSSSKDVKKKPNKDNFFHTLHRFLSNIETKGRKHDSRGRRHCNDTLSEMDPRSRAASRSPSPSNHVSRCQSFSYTMHAQPLPLPQNKTSTNARVPSGMAMLNPASDKPSLGSRPPAYDHNQRRLDAIYIDGDLTTASISSNCSTDTDDPVDSQLLISVGNDIADTTKTVTVNPSSLFPKDRLSCISLKMLRGVKKPVKIPQSNHTLSMSPKPLHITTSIKKSHHGAFASAPDSSLNSPCRSPKRLMFPEQISNSAFWAANPYPDTSLLGSGQCSSPGSGQTSGHNSMSGQLFWQTSRASPECSPIPSPRLTSPGPGSRIQSGAVTPLHPHAEGTAPGSPSGWIDNGKKQSHRLPLPPINIPSTYPFTASNKIPTNMSIPRSPGKSDNPTSPGSRWKKGKLIGRGTFGHVYVGFNSENGEMCAMKEVTLFDDAKSRESAKQLGQEVSLLSRLQHHNIVQYYGSETVDDRLYIYLEYVSGGSIHKLLQEYGQFGELAIRSFTYQILSGLAYLHAKNTVHRDIKGANILVDPNGRVKLADFGMAKHITGQSCPLSFKGSPYWMAPEVIKNTNGCNLSVDIWSLGCTVLEMATSKPPWSQYEGIAAMFKIGNSKELPFIPNSLSSDGKDFIRKCLQRDPINRPTATELLKHPFVRNAAPLQRAPLCTDQLESSSNLTLIDKAFGHSRNFSSLDMESFAIQRLKAVKVISAYSDFRMRNVSCPVSPIRSPLLHPRSPKRISGRISPSPICSPTTSCSSTPRTCGYGVVSSKQLTQSYMHKGHGSKLKSSNYVQANGSTHFESRHGHHHMKHDRSFAFRECQTSDSDTQGIPILRSTNRNISDSYDFPTVSSDTLSQKKDHIKMKTRRI